MKQVKRIIVVLLTIGLITPIGSLISVRAQEYLPEERDLSERTGLLQPEIYYVSEKDIPKGYTYEKKILGSSAYGTDKNREWSEYSSYFYYNQLTWEERSFYDDLMNVCLWYLTESEIYQDDIGAYTLPGIDYRGLNIEDAINIYLYAFRYSNPQFYFLENGVLYHDHCLYPMVYKAFATQESRQTATEQMKSALSDYENEASNKGSEYEKVRAIHDIICKNVTYDKNIDAIEQRFSQSAYSALIERKTVCAGYAAAFTMLCNKLGIDAIVETSSNHAWNRVAVDDIWYFIDCTWDDRNDTNGLSMYYKYFLRNSEKIKELDQKSSHVAKEYYAPFMPSCTIDCLPSGNNYSIPGSLPVITETADPPVLISSEGKFTLSAEDGARIYYTIDGSTPAEGQSKSFLYTSEVSLLKGAIVKAYSVVDQKKNSHVENWTVEKYAPFSIDPSNTTIYIGEKSYLRLLYLGDYNDDTVKWSSSDEGVATVTDGMVEGISSGTAIITAEQGINKATTTVTVVSDITIKPGEKAIIKVKKKAAKIEIIDKSIISVKNKGKKVIVEGKALGSTIVRGYNKKGKVIWYKFVEVK